jgi:amino acid transporter
MKIFKKTNLIKIIIFSFFILVSPVLNSLASYNFADQTGLNVTADQTGHTQQKYFNSADSLNSGIGQIVSIVLSLLGVIFLVLLIFGGIQWMTAGGNDEQVKKAKNVIIRSIIGLIIILLAYIISVFVITAFSNNNLLD